MCTIGVDIFAEHLSLFPKNNIVVEFELFPHKAAVGAESLALFVDIELLFFASRADGKLFVTLHVEVYKLC